jgi:hypothetical protein
VSERKPSVERLMFRPVVRAMPDGAEGEPRVTFILSTGGIKRDDNIIDQNGWDLANYRNNPQVLWAHDYSGRFSGTCPTIGTSEKEWVEQDSLRSVCRFTPKELGVPEGFGFGIGRMVQAGYLNAVSVGWNPIEWTYDEQAGGYRFLRQELLEYSVVPIPADPDALAQRKPLRQWAREQHVDLRPVRAFYEQMVDEGNAAAESALRSASAPLTIVDLGALVREAVTTPPSELRQIVADAMR